MARLGGERLNVPLANTRKPHVGLPRSRARTRDMHNHERGVAILEIAMCFPPEGIEPATLEVTHTGSVCPVIFLAGLLKNARRVPLLSPRAFTLSFSPQPPPRSSAPR